MITLALRGDTNMSNNILVAVVLVWSAICLWIVASTASAAPGDSCTHYAQCGVGGQCVGGGTISQPNGVCTK